MKPVRPILRLLVLGALLTAAALGGEAGPDDVVETQPGTVGPQLGEDGFAPLFNGKDLRGWAGALKGYVVENGILASIPDRGGRLHTETEHADFILRFEFRLSPGANNGLCIRCPEHGDPAFQGIELQILDDDSPLYKDRPPWYRHGSIFGVVPAKTGHLKPLGQWNAQEVTARGSRITVRLNGAIIVDADLAAIVESGQTADGKGLAGHPGLLRRSGRIAFNGSGARVEFRNVRIRELK